jgi:hypothetical protein
MDGIRVRRVAVLRCNGLSEYLMATSALAAGDGCTHRPSFLGQIPVAEVREEVADLLSRYPIFGRPGQRNDVGAGRRWC